MFFYDWQSISSANRLWRHRIHPMRSCRMHVICWGIGLYGTVQDKLQPISRELTHKKGNSAMVGGWLMTRENGLSLILQDILSVIMNFPIVKLHIYTKRSMPLPTGCPSTAFPLHLQCVERKHFPAHLHSLAWAFVVLMCLREWL